MLVACRTNGAWMAAPPIELEPTPHLVRSYYKAIELGYLTEDPSDYFDRDVCAKYINSSTTATPQS